MTWNYAYTPDIGPSVLTFLLLVMLAIYSSRRRRVPGALPFMVACLFAAAWAIGSVMEYAALDLATKIFWIKFQAAWQVPVATAVTCFVLEYTWPGRWLTHRNLALLSFPPVLILLIILTDNLYHLAWRGFTFAESIQPQFSPVGWIAFAYTFGVLGTINLVVFGWLFLRSSQHRWPVVLMLVGQFGGRTLYMLERTGLLHSVLPIDLLGMAFEFLMYALALFGFRIFDPITLARQEAIEQLQAGLLVLDPTGRIVSHNPVVGTILGLPEKQIQGRLIGEFFSAYSDPQDSAVVETETSLENGLETRTYLLKTGALKDWRGVDVGHLLLLHDVTGQKRAQAQIVEQQRALAILHEREQLARELHDSIGQVLGYVKMQAQAARDWLAQGKKSEADSSLAQLVAVAQEAHEDVREYILGVKTATQASARFLPTLRNYLGAFSEHYLLQTELIAPPDWSDDILEPTVEAQLLRIIQEALTNARKHARAQRVQVCICLDDSRVQVIVQDDGVGFDIKQMNNGEGQKYGLGFMYQRAQEVGGSMDIQSTVGQGTRVIVEIPVRILEVP